jgi:hypothetical protein
MNSIINKKSYWGEHTFEATLYNLEGEEVILLEVFKSFPIFLKKQEGTFFIKDKKHLAEMAADKESSLRFFVGHLGGQGQKKIMVKRTLKTGREVEELKTEWLPTIDLFIESFKYNID